MKMKIRPKFFGFSPFLLSPTQLSVINKTCPVSMTENFRRLNLEKLTL